MPALLQFGDHVALVARQDVGAHVFGCDPDLGRHVRRSAGVVAGEQNRLHPLRAQVGDRGARARAHSVAHHQHGERAQSSALTIRSNAFALAGVRGGREHDGGGARRLGGRHGVIERIGDGDPALGDPGRTTDGDLTALHAAGHAPALMVGEVLHMGQVGMGRRRRSHRC